MSSEESMMETATAAFESSETAKDKLKNFCMSKGYGGLSVLGRLFRRADKDHSGTLTVEEITNAINQIGLELSEDQMSEITQEFDADGEGTMNYEEFLTAVRPEMNEARMAVVIEAFESMDQTGNGEVSVDDFKVKYNLKEHPSVVEGIMTEEEIMGKLKMFLFGIEDSSSEEDGVITKNKFIDYYSGISYSVDSDDLFIEMVKKGYDL